MISTDEFNWVSYQPHGSIRYYYASNIMFIEATGPFNREILEALKALQRPFLEQLRTQGQQRADVVVFKRSCMATLDALEVFRLRLFELAGLGIAPLAVCHVMDSAVEGRSTMAPLFAESHAAAGIDYHLADSTAEALAWLSSGRLNPGEVHA